MHPAPSVIIFTTFSGLGFGLLFWLGIDPTPPKGLVGFIFFAIAYALAVGGLLTSTFHLGHPERFLKAFSQWRSSWLSREGIASVATLIVMGLYALGLVFVDSVWQPLGWLGAIGALATVFTTAMIYTQMKTIPRWRHWTTPALFLSLSLAGGALLTGRVSIALGLLIIAALIQLAAWYFGDQGSQKPKDTLGSATGLGGIGKVRAFEPPHTGTNYLLREFAFEVGRKHARNLRFIGMGLAFVVPVMVLLTPIGHVGAGVAVLSHIVGVLALRWLFFAEAKHVVGLYYGK